MTENFYCKGDQSQKNGYFFGLTDRSKKNLTIKCKDFWVSH
jgi:hypothetical protein